MKKAWFTLPIDELNVLGDLPFFGMVKYNAVSYTHLDVYKRQTVYRIFERGGKRS